MRIRQLLPPTRLPVLVNGIHGRGEGIPLGVEIQKTTEEFCVESSRYDLLVRRGAKYPPADVWSVEKLFLFPMAKSVRWDARVTYRPIKARETRAIRPANRCFIRDCPSQEGSRRIVRGVLAA